MADLLTAAQTQLGYAVNEAESGDVAKALTHIDKAQSFLTRAAAETISDEPDQDTGLFRSFDDESVVYLEGGSPGNPDGVSFSIGDAKEWWQGIFDGGLNISHVRPTLTPGSYVLTAEGVKAAQELGRTSTNYADADYNPLDLPVIE